MLVGPPFMQGATNRESVDMEYPRRTFTKPHITSLVQQLYNMADCTSREINDSITPRNSRCLSNARGNILEVLLRQSTYQLFYLGF